MDANSAVRERMDDRLEAIRARDATAYEALTAALPGIARAAGGAVMLEPVLALCADIVAQDGGQLAALAPRLEYLLDRLDTPALHRWVLTGLRLYPNHPALLSRYWDLSDPAAARSLELEAEGVSLARRRNALQYVLAGFGMPNLDIKPCRQDALNALARRSAISDGVLLLPEHYLAIDGAACGDIYLAAVTHALAHLRFSPRHQPAGRRKPMHLAILGLIEDARVERLMCRDYPGLHALWGNFHTASGERNELDIASLTARLARAIHDASYSDPNHWVNKGRDLFEQCASDLERLDAFNEVASILANDLGQMRVRFVPEQYRTTPAYRDDNTLLWEFDTDSQQTPPDEALARESVQWIPREQEAADVPKISPVLSTEREVLRYPEWDCRISQLRPDWATIIDAPAPSWPGNMDQRPAAPPGLPRRAVTPRARLLDRALRMRRQHEGEELDLDAAIESRVSMRGRMTPDPRIFQRPGKRRRTLAILLLLDLSESTNDRIAGSFTSVLDLEKQAARLLAESADPHAARIAIHGFASNGRNEVRYTHIKEFDVPFGDAQSRYLARQQGSLSTRMGAALRHAQACLARETAEKKVLMVLTDGEPSDIDVVDREYLIEDARHAIDALSLRGIDAFCLTLDRRADRYVRRIFGDWNFLIIDNAVSLPHQLARSVERIIGR
ncbi:nitric oxide reductase activation protein NorD [Noviherbaspirillum pedocola]|uniref:VWA domain-containing protein n=1 Tax=Noviherbaspirillum pedocola TaxID=2801341 RepID=A0A934SZT9_9BURK|nr:VWA domain-containing protein [Noviherbaspirillum pedocola]MBK4738813.1 VWA domain-containing protein [Noviherbaspirillum pedocola]